jgi:hypothetical protein
MAVGSAKAAEVVAEGPAAPGLRYATELRYTDRAGKARYIAAKYGTILGGSVLDVGCDRAPLRGLVGQPERYMGVDVEAAPGGADVVIDLDERDRGLPFLDRAFDTVVCTDVLEHLERCHAVFDELCRVSAGRVIVSLPNPLRSLVLALFDREGGGGGKLKFYGLPLEPPADRHRWFFGYEEARSFVEGRAAKNGFAIEQEDVESSGTYYWLDRQGRDVLDHPNVRHGNTWWVLARAGDR